MKRPYRQLKPEDTELSSLGGFSPLRYQEGKGLDIHQKDVLSEEEKEFLRQIGHLLEKLRWGEAD